MDITITGRKLTVSDAMRAYAEEKVGNSMKVMDIHPLSVDVVLSIEKNPAIASKCKCEVTLRTHGHIIRVEEIEEDMYAAIDVAAAKVLRQLRKFKTRVVERKFRPSTKGEVSSLKNLPTAPFDPDKLMEELEGDEEAVVRVKEMEFPPLTEQEALIQIDLLGHDFFVYTDRDTNVSCVLYRRENGGYGLIKQKD